MSSTKPTTSWEEKARLKREALNSCIPSPWVLPRPIPTADQQRDVTGKYLWQFLSPKEIEITETDAPGIVKQTSTGQWTAEEVVRAFAHRAALAHQLVNCLHEFFLEDALSQARALDAHFTKHKSPIGPLHGLPVSLKDQFHIKGVETTMGYVGWIGTFQGQTNTGREKVFESELVRELRNLGAVLYCKTSVPHTLMSGETINNIIGYTWNPKNRLLSSGGSSGGEGALIALKGSPLGFGSDIGGSIRIPAAFNGLYGLRPSSGRMPYEGVANSMDGQNTILSVIGPLSTTLSGLRLAMKSVLSQTPWLYDPLVHELPWRAEQEGLPRDTLNKPQLCFAVMRDDKIITPYPPVNRALSIAVESLEKQGHKVIAWEGPCLKRAADLAFSTWIFDGGADIDQAFKLSGEPSAPQVQAVVGNKQSEQWTAGRIAEINVAKRQFQKEYLDYWNSTASSTPNGRPVEAIIAPVAPFPAAAPQRYSHYGYTTFVNLLDYTSCVIPVTTADKGVDQPFRDFKPYSKADENTMTLYDPDIFDGAHVSLQVIGRRLQEEKVLAVAEYVADTITLSKGTSKL